MNWSSMSAISSIWRCWTTIRCACIAEKDSSNAERRSLTPRLVSLRSGEICLGSGYWKDSDSLAEVVGDGGAGTVWTGEDWPSSMRVSSGEVGVW